MELSPLVSVIVPVYNAESFLSKALDSVLNQDYPCFEVVVVNDGSVDNTESIIEMYAARDSRLKWINNPKNLGIQKTLNAGINHARGEWIARIDADDTWNGGKLKSQMDFLVKNTEYVLLGTGAIFKNLKGEVLKRYTPPLVVDGKTLERGNCFIHSSVIFKKDSAIKVGGYDESSETRHVEDYDLWFKLEKCGRLGNLNLLGVNYFINQDGITNKNAVLQAKNYINIIKKYRPDNLFLRARAFLRYLYYVVKSKS